MSLLVTIIFACAPFIAIPLIILGIVMDKKHNVIYGILLALLLAMIAYNFNPKEGHDLYRYYFEMDSYYSNIDFAIHVDAGKNGKTREVIPDIVEWVKACGFECETKPNSFVASSIADKYSK